MPLFMPLKILKKIRDMFKLKMLVVEFMFISIHFKEKKFKLIVYLFRKLFHFLVKRNEVKRKMPSVMKSINGYLPWLRKMMKMTVG